MDRPTVDVYEQHAADYAAARGVHDRLRAESFAAEVEPGGVRIDLGCGPGHYLPFLGTPVIAADAAAAMLDLVRSHAPTAWRVRCDQEALPFRRGAIAGVWASKCLQHIEPGRLPSALAGLHRAMAVGGRLSLTVFDGEGTRTSDDDLPGRYFALWRPDDLVDLLVGAGFTVDAVGTGKAAAGDWGRISVDAARARTLADTVAPDMRLLMCGLNPSVYAADAGTAFARPGNRFWPAMRAAGLATVDRDPADLLTSHRIGMTDVVKRATVAAAELSADEYRDGLGRIERLCRRLTPGAVCLVGLAGWRAVFDRKAVAGWQPGRLGGAPVYLMPSTSGLNAHSQVDDLAAHLRRAAAGPPGT
jgi:TDG/mug DNA glycosylase family protein